MLSELNRASQRRIRERILRHLANYSDGLSLKEICRQVVGRRQTILSALKALSMEGKIKSKGDGVKSDPKRYSLYAPVKFLAAIDRPLEEATARTPAEYKEFLV